MRVRGAFVVASLVFGVAGACASFGTDEPAASPEGGAPPGVDAGAQDASTPPPAPGTFCASATHTVCDDFDNGGLLGTGFVDDVKGPSASASVMLVPSDASMPSAAEFTQQPIARDGSACVGERALVTRAATMSPLVTPNVAHLAMSLRLLAAPAATDDVQFAMLHLGDVDYQISLRLNGTEVQYGEYVNPGAYVQTDTRVALPSGAWVRLVLDVDVKAGTIRAGTAADAGAAVSFKAGSAVGADAKTQLLVGLPCTQGADAGATFDVDDITLDLE